MRRAFQFKPISQLLFLAFKTRSKLLLCLETGISIRHSPPSVPSSRTMSRDKHVPHPNCWNLGALEGFRWLNSTPWNRNIPTCCTLKDYRDRKCCSSQGMRGLKTPSNCSFWGEETQTGLSRVSVKTIIFVLGYLQWFLWLSIRLANYRFKISGSINTVCLMLFSKTNYLQVPIPNSIYNTSVNFGICFLHYY